MAQGTSGKNFNLKKVNGTTTDSNSGNKSAGTLRVVLATDQPTMTNAQPISASSLPLPTGAATSAAQTDKSQFTKLTDGTDTALITAAGEQNVIATAQPGVDIGDVTINNAAGASAVNIQDGGNSITVDGSVSATVTNAGTFVVQENGAALTSLQLLDDTVKVLGTDTYTEATTKGTVIGAVRRDANTTLVDTTNEIAPLQVNATGELKVAQIQPLPTGSNTIGALTANQSVNVSQINGATPLMGNGVTGTGSPRVTLVSDGTAISTAGYMSVKLDQTTPGTTNAVALSTLGANAVATGNGASSTGVLRVAQVNDGTGILAGVTTVTTLTGTTTLTPGTGATNLGKAVDSAIGATDTGVAALQVRDDALTTLTPVDGDYVHLRGNARGASWVAIEDGAGGQITSFGGGTEVAEDTQHSSGVLGGVPLAVRRDTPTPLAGTDNDYIPTTTDANGAIWVSLATKLDATNDTVAIGPQTTGGLTTYHLVSAATTNATNIKASAGQLYGWYIYNSNAAARKVAFHNSASAPTAGASIYFSLMIPAGGAANVFSAIGMPFSSGIGITTVTGLADSDSAAVAANDLIINLWYK